MLRNLTLLVNGLAAVLVVCPLVASEQSTGAWSSKTSVVQQLRDLTLPRHDNRFEGKCGWPPRPSGSSSAFHGNAVMGLQASTGNTNSFDAKNTTDTTPRHVEVRIRGNGRVTFPVRVVPGGTVEVIVYANNPANPTRHDPPRASSGLRSRGAPEHRKIVPAPGMIGGGGETIHYKYAAHGRGKIKVVITRPWDRKPMIDATVQVSVVGGR